MLDGRSAFQRFWSLGYTRLVPIVPPGAEISEKSTLYKRVGTKQDGRGKTPGTRGHDGKWSSFDWAAYEADAADLERWSGMGAGVGIKTGLQADGTSLLAIDADTLNVEYATLIRDHIGAALGRLPVRVGNAPKALYLCRVDGPFRYSRIEFGDERVEVLSDGKQFVAAGVHPKTGKPYAWPRDEAPFDELPVFKAEQITALLETLRSVLPAASKVVTEGAAAQTSQAALRGELETVRKAVAATPNTSNHFPTREAYRDMGYAIKAALPDDEPAAFDIFTEWCQRWTDGINEPDVVEADWRRMKPPFRRGASWLYAVAAEHGEFDPASAWFEPIVESDNPFAPEPAAADVYPLLSLEEIVNRPPPTYLVGRHIPEISVGFLYSVPGAGKSFFALDIGLHLSGGLETWHGDAIAAAPESVVLYIAAEGSFGFRNRVKAWMQARHIESLPKRFLMIERTIDFMNAEDIDKLLRTVRAVAGLRPCLIVVDTVSRAMPGADENLQKEMTLFVAACDRLKEAFRCAVLGVHHAGKNGDMRGSTVLLGAGDFVFRLDRKQGATIGTLHCEKQKDTPDGWSELYHFGAVALDNGQSSLVIGRADLSVGPSMELTPAVSEAVLGAMRTAWEAGEPWAKSHLTRERFGVRRMVQDFGFSAAAAEELLRVWEGSGVISDESVSQKSKKRGFKVAGENGQHVQFEGVFG